MSEDQSPYRDVVEQLIGYGASTKPATYEAEDGATHIMVPAGYKFDRIPPFEKKITRIRQAVTLHDLESYINYVNQFKTPAARIFAEAGFQASGGKAYALAVLDYHQDATTPGHSAHTAMFVPRYSEAWTFWSRFNGGSNAVLKQAEFAELIEERRFDINDPAAASLLDVVRTLKMKKDVDYDSLTYQSNGGVVLNYSEKVSAQGKSGTLPEKLTIGMPVYYRGEPFAVDVFVRYKLTQGVVTFNLKVDRPDLVEEEAFKTFTEKVANDTAIDVYIGRT